MSTHVILSAAKDLCGFNNMKEYSVYILSNKSKTLYIGVTNNIYRRIYEHKLGLVPGFAEKYNLTMLVYIEMTSDIHAALSREKQLKGWLRSKKVRLIEKVNPNWIDLSSKWDLPEILHFAQDDTRGNSISEMPMTSYEALCKY